MRHQMKIAKKNTVRPARAYLSTATAAVLEPMEKRMMMSTTVTAWNFDSLPVGTSPAVLNPAPSTGSGTAYSIGMQPGSANANASGGVYAYPTSGSTGALDISDILNGVGNNPTGNLADHSSTGDGTNNVNPAWRIRGSTDGWGDAAPLGTQGAQFDVSTVGVSGISVSFDLDPSSASAPAEVAVEYTTDGSTWKIAPSLTAGTDSSNGASDGVTVLTNTTATNANLVNGPYFQINNNADALFWQNGLTANFASDAATANNPNFAVRIVNAATGAAEFEVGGTSYPTAGAGNWRLDNIQIQSTGNVTSAPSITTQPTSQTVPAGNSVSFTAAAAGFPAPSVQWYSNTGSGFVTIPGATSPTLSFVTSSTATDNGTQYEAIFSNSQGNAVTNVVTLNDALYSPTITTQPVAQTLISGNSANFSVVASGSPAPTYQWRSAPAASGPYTNVASGGTSSTYSFVPTTAQSGTYYDVLVTNSQGTNTSTGVLLTVNATPITSWNFTSVVAAPDNNPAPTTGSGTASSLGFTNTYPVPAVTNPNSVTTDDITSGVSPEDAWRVRGQYAGSGSTGTTGNIDGWNSAAPQYSQGVEFDVSTVNYSGIKASFDWEATSTGVRDLQEQYNLNINNAAGWTNINALLTNSGAFIFGSTIDLSSISGANNDSTFGIRLVSAYDPTFAGGTTYTQAKTPTSAINNTGGNWGFDNIAITGTHLPVAPTIATQPTSQVVLSGSTATFTAAANSNAFPVPTVQWYSGTPTGTNAPVAGATSNTFNVSNTTLAQSGNTYFAIYSNVNGTATTNVVSLTVDSNPVISTNPVAAESVTVGNLATFTAKETTSADVAITTQWQTSTGSTWTNIAGATNSSAGTTTSTYSFYPSILQTGTQYRATFTSIYGTIVTTPSTLTVQGVPVTQWNFQSGQGPLPVAAGGSSPANTPTATLSGNPGVDAANVLGMNNDFSTPYSAILTGSLNTQSYPEADILPERSVVNASFNEYVWRVRGGLGTGSTGAPGDGNADGWSQNAPAAPSSDTSGSNSLENDYQGVQFNVDTAGYSDITLHFDWNQGGVGDMQAQYSPDGGAHWFNTGGLIQATGTDYSGITGSTTPTGITVNLQNVSAANNNPNFALRLVSAYDPGLPLISDGNALDPAVHGQYASAGWAPTSAVQQMLIGTGTGSTYTLTYNGKTTDPIPSYGTGATNEISNDAAIQAALDALSNVGAGGVTVLAASGQVNIGGQSVTPYDITFGGTLANKPQPNITASDANISISTTTDGVAATVNTTTTAGYTLVAGTAQNISVASATGLAVGDTVVVDGTDSVLINSITGTTLNVTPTVVNISTVPTGTTLVLEGVSAFANGGGSWALGNISFNGIVGTNTGGVVTLTGPSTLVQPSSITVPGTPINSNVSFTATDYSEPASGTNTVAWYVNKNDGSGYVPVSGGTVTNTNVNKGATANELTSTYSFTQVFGSDGQGGYVGSGYTYEAFFTNSAGTTPSYPATLTVVDPVAPNPATIQDVSVQAGNVAVFRASAAGVPSPSIQWQTLIGGTWTNINNSAADVIVTNTFSASVTSTLSIENALQGLDGTQYRAVFTSQVGTVNSNVATLHVLADETVITDWNFAAFNTSATSVNSPLPSSGVIDPGNPNTYVGTASMAGMTLAYNPGDPATGTDGYGTAPDGDITNSPGALNPNFNENTWRIRGGDASTLVAGSPANGWSNDALQFTQGVQFLIPTTGYANVYVTMDWYSTTSGILDARQQYTLDGGTTWFNLDDHQVADTVDSSGNQTGNLDPNDPFPTLQAVSNDFYGATATGGPIPVVFNLSNIPGAQNNPGFGIRLTSAYNAILTAANNGVGTYANAALVGSPAGPAEYNGNKGNWRFDNIIVHGDPTWLTPTSAATWDEYTQTLTVTGSATITGDPATTAISNAASVGSTNGLTGVTTQLSNDYPIIVGSAAADQLSINSNTTDINLGGLTLSHSASVSDTSSVSNLLIFQAGGPVSITSAASLDLAKGYADFQATSPAQGSSTLTNVTGLLSTGYNNGFWTGACGIVSSAAANDPNHLKAVGVILNDFNTTNGIYGTGTGQLGQFDGFTPNANDVLLRYTYYGDANLTGTVDGSDYSLIDSAFGHANLTGWAYGDFNYDGVVDGSDYTLIDNVYNTQGGDPLTQIAAPTAQIAHNTGSKKTTVKANLFASGHPIGSYAGTASAGSLGSTPIDELLKHDRKHILAGALLDGSTSN